MRVLDLFSGLGGFSLGLERAGMKTVAFCEINPFCRRVLAKHWPEVPILGDVTTAEFPAADVVVGGFPCQDVSRAGPRTGVAGARSGLYRQLVRAIRLVRPKHAIMENVAALLDDGLGTVLGDLAESGLDAEWDCVPTCALGLPHQRDRIWIVAHAARDGRGQGRSGRPPDSFARVRDEARRHDWPDGSAIEWAGQSPLLGTADAVADRVERVRAIGNSLDHYIPELIGRAIMERV